MNFSVELLIQMVAHAKTSGRDPVNILCASEVYDELCRMLKAPQSFAHKIGQRLGLLKPTVSVCGLPVHKTAELLPGSIIVQFKDKGMPMGEDVRQIPQQSEAGASQPSIPAQTEPQPVRIDDLAPERAGVRPSASETMMRAMADCDHVRRALVIKQMVRGEIYIDTNCDQAELIGLIDLARMNAYR